MTITVLFFGALALVVGAVLGWVVASAKKSAEVQRALAQRDQVATERDLAKEERTRSDAARGEMQRRLELAQQERAAADARAAETQLRLENHKQVEETFAALAHKAFRSVSESLVQTSKAQIDGSLNTKAAEIDALLKPVRDMIDNYRGELLRSEQTRNEIYGGLQEQIRGLMGAQEAAQREAARLATALQSPTVQGSWGEMSLKRCIELAGMSEHCRDFETQQTFLTEDGKRLRPDVIVDHAYSDDARRHSGVLPR